MVVMSTSKYGLLGCTDTVDSKQIEEPQQLILVHVAALIHICSQHCERGSTSEACSPSSANMLLMSRGVRMLLLARRVTSSSLSGSAEFDNAPAILSLVFWFFFVNLHDQA